jgi:predicted N-acetyltransferase YhbS
LSFQKERQGLRVEAGKELTMITIRNERSADAVARESLLDVAFGESRFGKTAERLREGRLAADRLSFVAAERSRVIGTVRLWDISIGPGRAALLLGPLAVVPERRNLGIGAALMRRAIRDARRMGHRALILVGDAPYYGRFGFTAAKTGVLWLPGPYERDRLLGLELVAGSLDGVRGLIGPTGQLVPKPDLGAMVACFKESTVMSQAA